MTVVKENVSAPPLKITSLWHGRWAVYAVKAALELDLFSVLKQGGQTAGEIAAGLACDPRGTKILLDALVGLELVGRVDDRYRLTEPADLYLVQSSPLYIGDYLKRADELDREWSRLTEAIRAGHPVRQVNHDDEAQKFFPDLAAARFPLNYTTAQMVARQLAVETLLPGARVLDIACGSGVWSIAMAELNKNLQVDAVDFPPVLAVTRRFAERCEVLHQYAFIPGNWREVKLEENTYDVAILGHILHSEGRDLSRQLLKLCHDVLQPGGRLVIAEFMPNNDRTGPPWPLLFELNMFLLTERGCVFTANELSSDLEEAGFTDTCRLELPFWGDQSPIVLASK